jgi:drug/metabolite transporter (DMT)-like permease
MSKFANSLGSGCDWRIVALARSCLALVFALSLARLAGAKLVFWNPPTLWLRSITGSLSLLCTFFALTRLKTCEALTLTNTFPIWVALLSWPLLQVRPALSVWVAAACGVVGIAIIQQPGFETSFEAQLAMWLALVAAVTSALAMLGLHRLKHLDPWAIVVHFSAVATVFVLISFFIGSTPDLTPLLTLSTLAVLLGVGVSATMGQICLTRAFTLGDPAKVAVVALTQILFAFGLDFLFDGPTYNEQTLVGIGLVIAPTAWVMLHKANQ